MFCKSAPPSITRSRCSQQATSQQSVVRTSSTLQTDLCINRQCFKTQRKTEIVGEKEKSSRRFGQKSHFYYFIAAGWAPHCSMRYMMIWATHLYSSYMLPVYLTFVFLVLFFFLCLFYISMLNITKGVPQGSVPGPLLYLMYVIYFYIYKQSWILLKFVFIYIPTFSELSLYLGINTDDPLLQVTFNW